MGDISCPLQAAAAANPEAPAIVAHHRTWSWRAFHDAAAAAAHNLRRAGLDHGAILAIALPTGTPYPIMLQAALRLGVVTLPINTRFPSQYILDILKGAGCRSMMTPYGASITTLQGRLYALAPRDIVEESPAPARDTFTIPEERPAAIILTSGSSGSSGMPKAALHTFGSLWSSALQAVDALRFSEGDRYLLSLPVYHVAGIGIMLRCVAARGALVLPAANEGLAEAIVKYRVTHVSMVPTQLYRLLQQPDGVRALRGLKAILLGGSQVPEQVLRRAVEERLPVITSYGLTETASQVTSTQIGDALERLLTSGKPARPGAVRISAAGEIEVGGPTLFQGYVQQSQLIRPFTEDGWFRTGDLGAWDENGYLRVLGRRDNMFVSGGENVQPEEIEEALCRHEDILRAVVVPAPHPEYVQAPVAFVLSKPGTHVQPGDLTAYLRNVLPPYKIPKRYLPWPDEVSEEMKIQRGDFLERAEEMF